MVAFVSRVRDGLVLALIVAAVSGRSEAAAGEVLVTIDGVKSNEGSIKVDLCTRETFLSDHCPYTMIAPAVERRTELIFPDVPAGVYGVQAYHDANGNAKMDQNLLGFPLEGFAFGNGVAPSVAPPSFDEATVEVGAYGGLISLQMLYY